MIEKIIRGPWAVALIVIAGIVLGTALHYLFVTFVY